MRCPQICRRRTPCTHCAPARARRCRCRRTPCTRCAAGRARNLQREAAAAAFFASHTVSHVLAEQLPPHSLQSLRLLPCSQMPLPPPSLHWLRLRPCSQHHCRRRTPCTRCVASRDDNGRCLCRRSPCRGSAAARAWRYHTRRTGGGAARAGRGPISTPPKTPNTPNTPKNAKTRLFCFFLSFVVAFVVYFFCFCSLLNKPMVP